MKKRLSFIDWAKTIGIACICIGHFLPSGSIGRIFLYTFHVPVFFVISGFLANNTEFSFDYIKKLTKRLLIPYLIWFVISVFPQMLVSDNAITFYIDKFFFLSGTTIWNSALWFIPCYYIVNIVHHISTVFAAKNKPYMHLIMAGLFLGIAIVFDRFGIQECLFGINKCAYLLGVQYIGSTIRLVFSKIEPFLKKTSLLGFCSFLICGILSCFVNHENNLSIMKLDYNNIFFFFPISILMSLSFLWSCMIFKKCKYIELISLNTIPIMCGHLFFRLFLSYFLEDTHWLYLSAGLLVFVLFFVVIILLNKLSFAIPKLKPVFNLFGFQFYPEIIKQAEKQSTI